MHTLDLGKEFLFENYAAIDIETDGFDGREDNLIAIGVGYYDGSDKPSIEVFTRYSVDNEEPALIQAAYSWINERTPEGLVTYNGSDFDLEFLNDKMEALGFDSRPKLRATHLDLFTQRQELASRANEKWPRLEECLAAYGIPVCETDWNNRVLTGKEFGEELAPRYLRALEEDDEDALDMLEAKIREYATSDIEATVALYERDVNRGYTPDYV